jgi:hypothetical protein
MARAGLARPAEIDSFGALREITRVSVITIAVPGPLEASLIARMNAVGAHSKEEYLLGLLEADCAALELERTLAARLDGPFAPLNADWKDQVRQAAQSRE